MKFILRRATDYVPKELKKDYESLGFTTKLGENECTGEEDLFTQEKSIEVEIHTLEELLEFTRKWGKIVLHEDEITIYDDHLE